MSVPIGAMENGARNATVTLSTTGFPAVWPPTTVGDISYGPQTALHEISAAFAGSGWDLPWGFLPNDAGAPDAYMTPVMYSQRVSAWTWDVSNADVEAMDECVLTVNLTDGTSPAVGFVFGIESVDGPLGVSDPNWSNTTLVNIAWIGGSFDDLSDYETRFLSRAQTWPWAPVPDVDEPYLAGQFDLLDFVTPIVSPNVTEERLEIPLANWEYWLTTYDWVSLVFTTAVIPTHFWMWGDFEQFDEEANPYVGRNWIPFNPQSFLFSGHPLNDVTISIVPLVDEVAIEAVVSLGGLSVRARTSDDPLVPRLAAPPTLHAARRFRDQHR